MKRVALRLSLGSTFCRDIVSGVIDYTRKHGAWDIDIRSGAPFSFTSWNQLTSWNGDGIIAPVYRSSQINLLLQKSVPVVNIANHLGTVPFPTVTFDSRGIGELAAEHLLSLNLERFTFVGPRHMPYSILRYEGFAERLARSDFGCRTCWTGCETEGSALPLDGQWVQPHHYSESLRDLVLPTGVFAATDRVGYGVLKAARGIGLSSPSELSLVSVDNDTILCDLAQPTMSSIAISGRELGYRAAKLLDALMSGGGVPAQREDQSVGPGRLVQRSSSDLLAVEDARVAAALRYIRNNADRFFTVTNVVDALTVSRRSLERRFRQAMGTSLHDEIARTHVERAKKLLKETNWSVTRIAKESGFNSTNRFEVTFRKLAGANAGEYRKQAGEAL